MAQSIGEKASKWTNMTQHYNHYQNCFKSTTRKTKKKTLPLRVKVTKIPKKSQIAVAIETALEVMASSYPMR